MVLPAPRRAWALLLAALLLPLAAAQSEPVVDPEEVEPPEEVACTQPIEECLPDLIPSNPTLDNIDERYPSTACTDFLNIGDAPTATPFRVRLAIDNVVSGEKQFSKTYQRGEGEANVCWEGLMLVGGRHTLSITVDAYGEVPESDEKNNERAIAVTVRYTPRVDLKVTGFTVTPYEGVARANQVFVVNVTNIGNEVSNATIVTIRDDNGLLGNYTLPSLQPRETRQIAHATRPELRPVGTFIAHAVVDPDNTVSELSESNNEMYAEYVVLEHPAPDLVISNVTLSGNFTELRGVLARATVRNDGDRFARGIFVRALNESGQAVQESYANVLLYPNQSVEVQLRLVLRAGERVIRFQVDPTALVGEKDELNNNESVAMNITKPVVVILEPNLVVERIYAMPNDPRPGEAVSVGALVRNVGSNKSNATFVNFSIDGKPVGSAAIPTLAINNSYSAYVPWVSEKAGTFRIDALADGGDKVREIDELDNALALSFSVTPIEQEEDEEEPPTNVTTPPVLTPPTNVTPTPTPPTRPPTNASNSTPRIAIADMLVETRDVPGGVKGIVSVSLRNPSTVSIGSLIEVTFKVDDEVVSTKLVQGLRGAATQPATTGEIDLPAGNHSVTAEVRLVGTTFTPIVRTQSYETEGGAKSGIPGPGAAFVLALALALALATRRR